MEVISQSLSKWFYLGAISVVIGAFLIFMARGQNKSKRMENGYFLLILGFVGVISEWTDFATVLFIFVIIASIVLVIDKLFLISTREAVTPKQHYVYYAREFFPVVLGVWVLRAFLFEAYQIPSSSMRPDLTVGDFILVNKFNYGIREPFTNKVLIKIDEVKRGDVIVFKDQQVKNRDLIKRVVGVGGDRIEYQNKRLTINGAELKYTPDGTYTYSENYPEVGNFTFYNEKFIEDLTGVKHPIITYDQVPSLNVENVINFPNKSNCIYVNDNGFSCTVPQGEYFMMGDNRDNSADSRYWGFVPNKDILGKAIYVIINLHDFKRIGIKI